MTTMKHDLDLDLRGNDYYRFQFFPDAVAAMEVPSTLDRKLTMLVWGVVALEPQQNPLLWARLPESVRQVRPTSLYLSGWGTLTFANVIGGQVSLKPYAPTFSRASLFLESTQSLEKVWVDVVTQKPIEEHAFEFILEQPLGHMSLVIRNCGNVTLSVNASDFVTLEQLRNNPEEFGYDWTRSR